MPDSFQKKKYSSEIRVVEASAGSGKTYALAKHYVQLLLNPSLAVEQIPLRNILAITFTNKAAFEMKARILEFLKIIALGQLSPSQEKDILGPLGLSVKDAQKKSLRIMEDLMGHYHFFQVETIDEFINALLSGCAFKIGLTANFKIKTNPVDYLQYSLDTLIARSLEQKNLAVVFDSFLRNYLYLEERSGWFPKEDILNIIYALFKVYNSYGLDFKEVPYRAEDLIKKKSFILKQMKELRQNLPEATHATFVKSLNNFLTKNIKGFDIDGLSNYFAHEEFPLKKGSSCPLEIEKIWESIRQQLKEFCQQESRVLFNSYIQIFEETKIILQAICSQENILFLDELNKKGEYLFEEGHITVEELYYRLATRFRHYLIDEFQDTSRLQWANLDPMIEEALSTGGTLFYVGDQKQAIYRFRGGDVSLFDEVKERFSPFGVSVESLTKNWRSQKAIVEFNNSIFSVENLERFIAQKEELEQSKDNSVVWHSEDLKKLENIFRASQQSYDANHCGGYVQVERIDVEKKEERDEVIRQKVLELMDDLKSRYSLGDIAILTRDNNQVKQTTHWLLEAGFHVQSDRTSDIREHDLIKELVAFLKFLNSPIDNLSFVQFILGDIFSQRVLKKEEIERFVFGLRRKIETEKGFYVYAQFRKEYPQLWESFVEEFFKNVGVVALYELVISIYGRLECFKNFPDAQGFFMHFLELIKAKEEDYPDIASFLTYFENIQGDEAYVHVTDANALKVLTIHKAKGLEFPVVILPFLAMKVEVGSRTDDHKQAYVLRRDADKTELIRLKKQYYKFSRELFDLYAREYRDIFISELNNVYVALTRAKQELYCFIPKKEANHLNLVSLLIPSSCTTGGEKIKILSKKQKDADVFYIPCGEYQDWIHYLKEECVSFKDISYREERLRGQYRHAVLSFIDNIFNKDIHFLIDEAVFKAQKKFSFTADIRREIEQLLSHKRIRSFFEIAQGEVFVEKEIVDAQGRTYRLDRLIVTDNDVLVLDFKSAKPEDDKAYRQQIKTYMDLVKALYPQKTVKGFLIFLDDIEVKEIL